MSDIFERAGCLKQIGVNLAESGTGKVGLKIGVDQPMAGGSDPRKLALRVCGFTGYLCSSKGYLAMSRGYLGRGYQAAGIAQARNCLPAHLPSVCLLACLTMFQKLLAIDLSNCQLQGWPLIRSHMLTICPFH